MEKNKPLNTKLGPHVEMLIRGIIHDLSKELATMDEKLSEREKEFYVEEHAFTFLSHEFANNPAWQFRILCTAPPEDYHTFSIYELWDDLPKLVPLRRHLLPKDTPVTDVVWSRLVGHFFARFLEPIKQHALGRQLHNEQA
jgi:hypothetical protein